jgi:hypothetical protein
MAIKFPFDDERGVSSGHLVQCLEVSDELFDAVTIRKTSERCEPVRESQDTTALPDIPNLAGV